MTYLNIAVAKGDLDAVKDFIENQKYSVNDTGYFYSHDTPLAMAAQYGRYEIMEYLIANGADINMKGKWGNTNTPIEFAIYFHQIPAIAILLSNNATLPAYIDKTAITNKFLLEAAKTNDIWSINKILTVPEADINFQDKQKMTPLHHAIKNDNFDTANVLLEKNANVMSQNMFGETPLHLTSQNKDTKAAQLLIEHGADVNHNHNMLNISPLHQATKDSNAELVELLIEQGANIEALNSFKLTPLMVAVMNDNAAMVKCLISFGAETSANLYGMAPLELAAGTGKLQALEALIETGLDLNHKNNAGKTALDIAYAENSTAAVNILVMHGAEVPEAIQAKLGIIKPIALDQVLPDDLIVTSANQETHQNISHANDASQVAVYNPASVVNAYIVAPDQNENYV